MKEEDKKLFSTVCSPGSELEKPSAPERQILLRSSVLFEQEKCQSLAWAGSWAS